MFQAMLSQIAERRSLGQHARNQLLRRSREKYRAGMTGGTDTSDHVDFDADIPLAGKCGLAGVNADSHSEWSLRGPRVRSQRALGFLRRSDGVSSLPEHEKG